MLQAAQNRIAFFALARPKREHSLANRNRGYPALSHLTFQILNNLCDMLSGEWLSIAGTSHTGSDNTYRIYNRRNRLKRAMTTKPLHGKRD